VGGVGGGARAGGRGWGRGGGGGRAGAAGGDGGGGGGSSNFACELRWHATSQLGLDGGLTSPHHRITGLPVQLIKVADAGGAKSRTRGTLHEWC